MNGNFRVSSFLTLALVILMAFMACPVPSHAAGVTPTGVIIIDGAKNTYGMVVKQATPVATPTDVVGLYGATGAQIRIKKVTVCGIATSAGSMDVSLVKRTTPDTGGTGGTAPTIGQYDSNQPATALVGSTTQNLPLASPALYTANPTVGTGVAIRNALVNFGLASSAATGCFSFDFMRANDKPIVLNNGNESLWVNLNGEVLSGGNKVSAEFEWEEIP